MTLTLPGRLRAAAIALPLVRQVIVPDAAIAQGARQTTPLFSMSQQYDSNVFSTAVRPEGDFVTRVSPGIATGYRTPRWTTTGRYLLDIERFVRHSDLNSMDARQHAVFTIGHHPTRRVAWEAGAEFWKTRTPGEFNGATGLTSTRAGAQRLLSHSSIDRQLNPLTSGTVTYAVTRDHLAGGAGATTQDASVGLERRRSVREALTLDYRLRSFAFQPAGAAPGSHATSHALLLGWRRAISSATRVTFDAGPRVTNLSTDAELAATVQHQRGAGDMALTYARTQTTVIGLAGVADTQSLSATAAWLLGSSMRMRVGPSVFRSELGGLRADAYVITLDLARPIAGGLLLDLSINSGTQRGSLYAGMASQTIARRDVLIRLVAGRASLVQ